MVRLGKIYPIKIPKEVAIRNGKLSLFQLGIQVLVVSLLLWQFIKERMYYVVQIPQGFPNAWVGGSGNADASAVSTDYNSDICRDNQSFLYKYSAGWTHGAYQCLQTPKAEAGFKIGKREIYFPTYFRETIVETESGSTCSSASFCTSSVSCSHNSLSQAPLYNFGQKCFEDATENNVPAWNGPAGSQSPSHAHQNVRKCACNQQSHYLVAGVSSRKMTFEHIFKVTAADTEVSGSSGTPKAVADEDENKLPVVSIIMRKDQDGAYSEYDCSYVQVGGKPGQCRFSETAGVPNPPTLTLQDWVAAASNGDIDLQNADARNPSIASNQAGSGYDARAPYRLTGVEVVVSIEYVGPAFHNRIPDDVDLSGFDNHMVALIKVSVNQAMWTGLPHLAYENPTTSYFSDSNFNKGKFRERYYYGIRFLFTTSTSSAYGAFSWTDFLTGMAVFKVYFGAAGAIVVLFALTALGRLSLQYKRATLTPLDLEYEATRVAPARILVAVSAFHGLCKIVEDENPKLLLTDEKGNRVIHAASVNSDVLNKCFGKVFGSGKITLGSGGIEALSEAVLATLGDERTLDVEKFVNAYLACDCLDLTEMQQVFDEDRKVGRLEQFFSTPLEIPFACENVMNRKSNKDLEGSSQEASPRGQARTIQMQQP
ncbi:unnamed protein product [Amoebophrya sp. A120]|nr:unnamed protein product [Amoebophrya sp. A120]|eukprot:GSA120T00000394001.1